ncbi:hypothetical protein BBJ28_00010211 [Nothophytophthora sp. Chile5]|nr:hypothetical protein BBJ28_00010211 [Nothophytophthora sp. Chile5]
MATYTRGCIFNTDETGVYFDESPGLIIAERGKRGSTKIKGKKRSFRATVLLAIAADGTKLPPLVVFKATSGDTVEDSFFYYPKGAFYAVQQNAWMDMDVWKEAVIEGVWADYCNSEDREPLALYVDNFKSHVSDESIDGLAAYGTEVVPLPPNTTAVLQPLEVGLMEPFKMRLRTLALSAEIEAASGESAEGEPRKSLRERLLRMRKMSSEEKRRAVAKKVIQAWGSISESNVRKAWIKSELYTQATE